MWQIETSYKVVFRENQGNYRIMHQDFWADFWKMQIRAG